MNAHHSPLHTQGASPSEAWPILAGGRIGAIDLFRALTVLLMITVNSWHGVQGLPAWMGHMPADVDAMSFVDGVFPAFLFIVGMSIPFALQQRLRAGTEAFWPLQAHVLQRSLGLLLLGVFMVNAEGGYEQARMGLPIALWALLSYVGVFLIWGSLSGGPAFARGWRLAGVSLLLLLAGLYRSADGSMGLSPQWWGILGLIGWAYLIGCLAYQLCRGNLTGLLIGLVLCTAYTVLHRLPALQAQTALSLIFSQAGHLAHGLLVLAGTTTALLLFDGRLALSRSRRLGLALLLASVLALAAVVLRPAFKISKIYATPSWALFSAAGCVLIFAVLWALRVGERPAAEGAAPGLLDTVAAHPLLAYLLPFVFGWLGAWSPWGLPLWLRSGMPGVLFGPAYALLIAALVRLLVARGLRLRI